MSHFKFNRESDYLLSSFEVSLYNISQNLLLTRLRVLKEESLKPKLIIPPSATAGRPSTYNWDKILAEYHRLNKPQIKPFCRLHGISPKLLRYHLNKKIA